MCLLLQSLERGGGKDDMVHIDYHKRRCDIVTQQHRILIIKSNLNPSTPPSFNPLPPKCSPPSQRGEGCCEELVVILHKPSGESARKEGK